jgi:DNA-binding CsgD family transcriptional regulator
LWTKTTKKTKGIEVRMRFKSNHEFAPQDEIKNCLTIIIKPFLANLFRFGVSHIGYRYFHPDGGSFGFTTNEKWYNPERTEEFFENQRVFLGQEISNLLINGFCYVTRSREDTDDFYLQTLTERDMSNSLGIYRFSPNKIEHFFFIASSENYTARDMMINYLSDLDKVVDELGVEIAKVFEKNKRPKPEFFLSSKIAEFAFLKTAGNIRSKQEILIKGRKFHLTRKEVEVLDCLKMTNSSKLIAKRLNSSPRTVEKHIESLKSKFCCDRIGLTQL